VGVGVKVAVAVGVGVNVAVAVGVGVNVAVAVGVGVNVAVAVGVGVNVAVGVTVGVAVGVGWAPPNSWAPMSGVTESRGLSSMSTSTPTPTPPWYSCVMVPFGMCKSVSDTNGGASASAKDALSFVPGAESVLV
jgi:hypothetical protein